MTGGVLKPLWRIDVPEVKIIDVFIAAAQEAGPGRATDLIGTVGLGYVLRVPAAARGPAGSLRRAMDCARVTPGILGRRRAAMSAWRGG